MTSRKRQHEIKLQAKDVERVEQQVKISNVFARPLQQPIDLYGKTGPGAITFWECEEILAKAGKREVRHVFTKRWPL